MAEQKTRQNNASVTDFLARVDDPQKLIRESARDMRRRYNK